MSLVGTIFVFSLIFVTLAYLAETSVAAYRRRRAYDKRLIGLLESIDEKLTPKP